MKRTLLFIAGWIMLGLGTVGIFLPVLPTTPFVLVSAGCFSLSSSRMYEFLRRSRYFGPYVENYRTKQGIPASSKVQGIVFLWALLIVSMIAMHKLWMTILLLVVGAAVTAHILLIRTKKKEQ